MKKVLIIEDDPTIIDALTDTFQFHDFEVAAAANGKDGYLLFAKQKPDLIILDIMLPGPDGYDICKKIRKQDEHIPIIMLTAKSQESDKLLGFELGADDYVTKPFSVKELVARVKAVLKRSSRADQNKSDEEAGLINIGKAKINFKNFTINREGIEYTLSPKESEILKLLVEHPGEVIHRSRIIDVVWGDEYFPSPRTIDNFILKLRNKIEEDPRNPVYILTAHGTGYKFKTEDR